VSGDEDFVCDYSEAFIEKNLNAPVFTNPDFARENLRKLTALEITDSYGIRLPPNRRRRPVQVQAP
jgi:hypothetical protein